MMFHRFLLTFTRPGRVLIDIRHVYQASQSTVINWDDSPFFRLAFSEPGVGEPVEPTWGHDLIHHIGSGDILPTNILTIFPVEAHKNPSSCFFFFPRSS